MEIKKTAAADIDSQRTTSLLIGLVVALALLLAALQFNSSPPEIVESSDWDDFLAQDLEAAQQVEPRDLVAVTQTAPTPTVVAEQIVETDDLTDDVPPAESGDNIEVPPAEIVDDNSFTEQPQQVDVADKPTAQPVLRVVEEYPEFPGGLDKLIEWLTRNLVYPNSARQMKIQGAVVVSFVVNKDGTVADAKVLKSVDNALDREALRVVKMMPPWKPGHDHGHPCRTLVRLPIVFKL